MRGLVMDIDADAVEDRNEDARMGMLMAMGGRRRRRMRMTDKGTDRGVDP